MRKLILAVCLALAVPAIAVVPSTASRYETTGDGATTAYIFTFPVTTSSSHVEVFLAGVKQVAGYTVALNANQSSSPGGTVTFTTPPANAVAVKIQRTVPLTQETVYTPYSAFPAKTTEKTLDRIVYQAQQIDRRVADAESSVAAYVTTYDLYFFFGGVPLSGELLALLKVPRQITLPANCTGSQAAADVAPTATATVVLQKNGASVATITFNTNGTTSFASSAVVLAPGDLLAVRAQSPADATLAGISITLAGSP